MTEKAKENANWAYKTVVVTFLTLLVGAAFSFGPEMVDVVKNRSFDSYEQKVRVLQKLEEQEIISESQRDQMLRHLTNTDRHMSAEEKEGLIIIRENQKRIGQDLQEIKNLLRNNN